MGGQLQETTVEQLPLAAPRLRLSLRAARGLAVAGRVGVVFLPAFALASPPADGIAEAVATGLLVTAVWLAVMRGSFAAGRSTLMALGPAIGAAVGTASGLVCLAALNPVLPALGLPAGTLAQMALAVFLLTAIWESVVAQSVVARRRVVIVGAADGGAELIEELALQEQSPFEIVGIVDDERETDRIAGVPLCGGTDDLPSVIDAKRPDLVVLSGSTRRAEAFDRLLDASSAGFRVVGLAEFYEHAFGRVPVRQVTPEWFMGVLHLYHRPYNRLAKRAFDVVVASIGLLLTAPILPILALLVKRTTGPVIFKQQRPGERGRYFTIYKFRTMRTDVEVPGGAALAEEHDPRITAIGRFMRRSRLDELPQLWNVLKGDMSIVGPRPEPDFVRGQSEEVPFWIRRRMVKPGITGWAQVRRGYTGADAESVMEKLSYDLWYLRHRSLVVDVAICAKTFGTLVTGSGAR